MSKIKKFYLTNAIRYCIIAFMENFKLLTIQKSFRKNPKMPLRGFFNVQVDMAPHAQEFTEVVFILHNKAEHYTEPGNWTNIQRGDVWIIPPGGIHGFRETAGKLQLFNLLFAADELPVPMLDLYTHPGYKKLFHRSAELSSTSPYPHFKLKPSQIAEIEILLKEFVCFSDKKAGQYGIFMAIISLLCELAEPMVEENTPPLDIQKVQSYFSENFAKDISIIDLCKLTSLSPSSLQRHFKKAFGTTPAAYLQEYRLEAACRLLLNSTRSIKEISLLTGFKDPSYFSRLFKQVYHCQPGEYRKIK